MRMHKMFAIILAIFLFVSILPGCEQPPNETTTTPTEDIYMNALHKTDPAADDVLYILTAAASNSHYFTDELYGVLAAAGIKAKVCNLMKSSTGIQQFYDYWKNDEKVFQLIIHDEKGQTVMEGMSLDMALSYYNWDVFNMQEGTSPHRTTTPEKAAADRQTAHAALVEHVRKCLPKAEFYYQ